MTYNLGAVGFGHWFSRLYEGLKNSNEFKVAKIAGTRPFETKIERMREMGLGEKDYYRVSYGESIPEGFYTGLDVVHISNPNDYHAEHTVDSLEHGKITVTEKTWGINRKEFESVTDFIKENNMQDKAYLHLHYLHKKLNLDLEKMLSNYTKKYGKVKRVSATLFEAGETAEQDKRRSEWLFSARGGGLFMDIGIHMFEGIIIGAKANDVKLDDVNLFMVREDYDSKNPTGIEAALDVNGKFFSPGARGTIRVAKGVHKALRAMRFYFESGSYLDLHYIHSDIEYTTSKRGEWMLYENGRVAESGSPRGLNNSEVFVNEILELCKGKNIGLTLEQINALFEPQWEYQEMIKSKSLERDKERVDAFVASGLKLE